MKSKVLSPKESAFCRAILTAKDQTAAALQAGYSPKTARQQGYRLSQRHKVVIARLRAKADETCIIDRNRIIKEWDKIAFLNSRVCYDEQDQLKCMSKMPEHITAAIAEIMDIQTEIGHSRKIKFHSKEAALKELAKLGGLYPESGTGEQMQKVAFIIQE